MPPDGQAARSTPPATGAPGAGSRASRRPRQRRVPRHRGRVLVVEDNRLNQRVARQMLEHLGRSSSRPPATAARRSKSMRRGPDRFDAILMDMQMPEMDGLQATRVIRKEFPKHAVPIIAATASVDGTDMTDCLDAGMNDYVPKPIEPRQLARVLSRWVTLPASPAAAPRVEREADGGRRATPGFGRRPTRRCTGVDVNAALVRLNGQHDLLVRLLRVFAQEHGKTTADIERRHRPRRLRRRPAHRAQPQGRGGNAVRDRRVRGGARPRDRTARRPARLAARPGRSPGNGARRRSAGRCREWSGGARSARRRRGEARTGPAARRVAAGRARRRS